VSNADVRTDQIQIVVNGRDRTVPAGLTLTNLLLHLDVDPSRVAVELNRAIVRKPDWEATIIEDRATLEIVQFVGGG